MLDLLEKVNDGKKIHYVWFNTGLEYQATKNHLKYLEDKYGIEIERVDPIMPIPLCVKKYGVPFLNKIVSERIHSLQLNNFKWEDEPYDVLIQRYPKAMSALKWWCNCLSDNPNGRFNISFNKYLKEFMIENPPLFNISKMCCYKAKKFVVKKYNKENDSDLNCMGVRKYEGGIRSSAYKTCYDCNDSGIDEFRPILWYSNEDKKYYKYHFDIIHSDCYEIWGMKRTGCCGCSYSRNIETELELIKQYEPKLYKACINIFGESYEYTKKYREFQKMMKEKEKSSK